MGRVVIKMSEDRLNTIEKAVDQQGRKIDKLVEGFAALAAHNERITRVSERVDKLESRVEPLETFKTQQQARREMVQLFITRVVPVTIVVGGAVLTGIKLYVGS